MVDDISQDEMMKEFDDLLKDSEQEQGSSVFEDDADYELVDNDSHSLDDDLEDGLDSDLETDLDKEFASVFDNDLESDLERDIDSDIDSSDKVPSPKDEFNNEPSILEKTFDVVKSNLLNTALACFSVFFLTTLFWPTGSTQGIKVYEDDFAGMNQNWGEFEELEETGETGQAEKTKEIELAQIAAKIITVQKTEAVMIEPVTLTAVTPVERLQMAIAVKQEIAVVNPLDSVETISIEKLQTPILIDEPVTINVKPVSFVIPESEIGEMSDDQLLKIAGMENIISEELPLVTKEIASSDFEYPSVYEEFESDQADPKLVAKNKEAVFLILEKMQETATKNDNRFKENQIINNRISSLLDKIQTDLVDIKKEVNRQGTAISAVTEDVRKLKNKKTVNVKKIVAIPQPSKIKNRNYSKPSYQIVSSRKGIAYIVSNRTGKLVRLEEGDSLIGYGKISTILSNYIIKTESGLVKAKPRV
jgi:hypothetical protein